MGNDTNLLAERLESVLESLSQSPSPSGEFRPRTTMALNERIERNRARERLAQKFAKQQAQQTSR